MHSKEVLGMAGIAVAAIVENDGKVLIGKKIHIENHFLSGKWHIPGGHVNSDENETDAVVREILEETGMTVKVGKFVDQFYNEKTGTLVKWYLCRPVTLNIKPGDDLEDAKFIPKNDVLRQCDEAAVSKWPPLVVAYFKQN